MQGPTSHVMTTSDSEKLTKNPFPEKVGDNKPFMTKILVFENPLAKVKGYTKHKTNYFWLKWCYCTN